MSIALATKQKSATSLPMMQSVFHEPLLILSLPFCTQSAQLLSLYISPTDRHFLQYPGKLGQGKLQQAGTKRHNSCFLSCSNVYPHLLELITGTLHIEFPSPHSSFILFFFLCYVRMITVDSLKVFLNSPVYFLNVFSFTLLKNNISFL